MTRLCNSCGAANPDAAHFCRACGAPWGELPIRAVTPLSPVAAKWRMLRHEMTRNEVRKLLGPPRHILADDFRVAGATETWTYAYARAGKGIESPLVTGYVKILVAESRVLAWCEPDWDRVAPGAEAQE